MVAHRFQSLTEIGPYSQAKREIMYRRLGEETQEKCKEEFVLSISILTDSQKTSILLQAQLEEKPSNSLYKGCQFFLVQNKSISPLANL